MTSSCIAVDYWPVAVFAHNLEGQIAACLYSLEAASVRHKFRVFILENGSQDRTAEVVEALRDDVSFPVQLVRLAMGDKANAWNTFVHTIAPAGDVVFFVDGDVQVLPHAFDELFASLVKNPTALAAAAFPHSGRNAAAIRHYLLETHELCGNLYALRGDTVQSMRASNVHIPCGYIGDDDFLSFVLLFNFDPTRAPNRENIVPCPKAQFFYPSLSWFKWQEWQLYYRRKKRYSLRYVQDHLLFHTLKSYGMQALPHDVITLYQTAWQHLPLRRRDLHWLWFDWLAHRAIRKALSNASRRECL